MYYRKEDQVIREDYNSKDTPASGKDGGDGHKKFPLWLLLLIIFIVLVVLGFLLWKVIEHSRPKKGSEQFGFRFY